MTTYSSTCRDLPGPGDLAGEDPRMSEGRDEITNDDIVVELIERVDSLRIACKQRDSRIFAECLRGLAAKADEYAALFKGIKQ